MMRWTKLRILYLAVIFGGVFFVLLKIILASITDTNTKSTSLASINNPFPDFYSSKKFEKSDRSPHLFFF